jgi:hypothetical protein
MAQFCSFHPWRLRPEFLAGIPRERARPTRLLCLTTSLEMGGAQMMLYRLLATIDWTQFDPQVISLISIEPMGKKIRSLGIQVRSHGMRPGKPSPSAILRLARWLRKNQPDVVQTWMYHADLIGGLATKLAGDIPVAWGIHQSDLSPERNRWLTLQTTRHVRECPTAAGSHRVLLRVFAAGACGGGLSK